MISKFDVIMYLETLFRKNINNITKEDMLKVTSISIEFIESGSNEVSITLSDIVKMFPNLKKVILKNKHIDKSIIDELCSLKLESLKFDACSILSDLSLESLKYLTEVSISNCAVLNFDFLRTVSKGLKSLSIVNPIDEKFIDVSKFTNFDELNGLFLESCVVYNIDYLSNLKKLSTLSLLWSDVDKIESSNVFFKIPNLKELYISDFYYNLEWVQKIPPTIKVYRNLNHLVLEEKVKLL